ncbi:MAG TPA: hypothetical protein PKJ26_04545 [Candidatus Woesebacteria bacterium]|nr:hypothetical protein [Candidatus Woesebacteria bacterium]
MKTEVRRPRTLEAYAQRVSPIQSDRISAIHVDPSIGGVELEWMQTESDYPSFIFVGFTDSEQAKEKSPDKWKKNPQYIIEDIAVGAEARTGIRNPLNSLRAVLTLLATIEEVALSVRPFIHIVRANARSQPYLKVLTELGIYHLSDSLGNLSEIPQMLREDEMLFASSYPTHQFGMLKKFVIPEFVDALKDFIERNTVDRSA